MNYRLMRITAASLALKISVRGQMKYMNDHGFEVTMVSSAGPEIPEVIANEGCPHIAVNISRKITPLTDIKTILDLYRLFKKHKPHIIHSENLKANLVSMIAGYFARVPVRIQTMAGLVSPNVPGIKGKLIRMAEIISFRFATDVWPNSQSSLTYMLQTKMLPARKAKVIGAGSSNGVDLNKFNRGSLDQQKLEMTKKAILSEPGQKALLFAGRMVKDKGVQELVAVFSRLYRQDPQLKLVLLGPSEDELDPLDEATNHEIKTHPAIIHIAWTDEVEYYLALAELFVFPSHREGFPNVLMQAGAMEVPVVCSAIFGNVDMVEDKQSGLLHEAKNEESLFQAVSYALEHPVQMREMACKLHQKMVTGYGRNILYAQYRDAYISLITEKAAGIK